MGIESIPITLTNKLYVIMKIVKNKLLPIINFLKTAFFINRNNIQTKKAYSKKVKEEYKNTLEGLWSRYKSPILVKKS